MAAAPSAAWRACLLVGVLGTACATAPPPAGNTTTAATPASSETVELSIGQPATALGGVRLALLEVQDQRCPVDVNCISAGYAKVTLEVRLPGASAQRIVIGIGGPPFAGPRDGELGAYRFSLASLEPRPSTRSPAPATASKASVLAERH